MGKSEARALLEKILAPQGILTVTTGSDEVGEFLQARFGTTDAGEVARRWRAQLDAIEDASAVVLGVPSDIGAGFERGSFKGPLAIRTALGARGSYEAFAEARIVDIGDVRVNPQLLDDSYYMPSLLAQVRAARGVSNGPVAPLSILRAALDAVATLAPGVPVLVIGGDHSLSRVPVEALVARGNAQKDLGILHLDAHTDLLDLREGVPYNFATWAHHANDAIGRGRRLIQVGVRVSGRPREEWEQALDLRQIRMEEVNAMTVTQLCEEVVTLLRNASIARVYISNDIDATDPTFAAATGTMELGGLMPDTVSALIAAVGANFKVVGSDVVEVAPPLKWHIPGEPARTIATAARYVVEQLTAMTGVALPAPFPAIEPATLDEVRAFPKYV